MLNGFLIAVSRNINKPCFADCIRRFSSFTLGPPELDVDYYLNESNLSEILNNVRRRKNRADIDKILSLNKKLNEMQRQGDSIECMQQLQEEMVRELYKLPNKTHFDVLKYPEDEPHTVRTHGEQRRFTFEPKTFASLAEKLELIRTRNLGNLTGHRSYYLKGWLSDLEQALVRFTVKKLLQDNFILMSVPDLISPEVIESCGMATKGQRTQVFEAVSPWEDRVCLAGTAEMPIAGLYCKHTFDKKELPLRVCAVSRCYRAETSKLKEENYGIFRVREFTKVEMFGITCNETGRESERLLLEFIKIQEELFSAIGLSYRVLDMPPNELGNSAHRKYDIEAWMPGRKTYGEISSASNCTDYQSRRLHVKYVSEGSQSKHVHTVNGTACAVPRMLIALFENFQNADGSVTIPEVLRPYMNGKAVITAEKTVHKMKWSNF